MKTGHEREAGIEPSDWVDFLKVVGFTFHAHSVSSTCSKSSDWDACHKF